MERSEEMQKEERINPVKMGVVTNFDTKNYGSVLQAYALQTKLRELGCDPFVLKAQKNSRKSPVSRIKNLLVRSGNNYSVSEKLDIKRSKKAFTEKNNKLKQFVDNKITVRTCTPSSARLVIGDADVMIAGSDQIWSPTAKMISEFTTLQFVPDHIKRYSFAASIGATDLDEESQKILEQGLERFSEVTVRESSAVSILSQLTDTPVSVTLDPTFLYDGEYWASLACAPTVKEPYIFVYMLRPEPVTLAAAKALSDKTGYKILLFSNRIVEDPRIINVTNAGIEEFLGYIKEAAYVVTNSFHGTAFSVQFKKRFVSVAVSGSGMRVTDFLELLDLKDRIIASADQIGRLENDIKWQSVDERIVTERNKATDYLRRIASDIDEKQSYSSCPVLFRDETECCGCGACANACPKNAIKMVADKYGYLYPQVDKDLCVGCGVCKNVCSYQNGYKRGSVLKTYGAVAASDKTRLNSSSGGIFTALAENVISNGGIVFGCSMETVEDLLTPMHVEISDVNDLHKLKKSKYAQSKIGDTYSQVKKHLQNERIVLFSGTACQIAGLKGYLGNKDYNNLFTVDIICHGVPSAKLLNDYISLIEKKKKIKVTAVDFRDKKYGWGVKGTITGIKNGVVKELYFDSFNSSYYNLYLKAGFYRENCYSCPYANSERPGDVTLGDFWGVDKQHPEWLGQNKWNKSQGISCILVNNSQGSSLLDLYGKNIELKDCTLDEITFKNKMLLRPSRVFAGREEILEQYSKGGYEAVDKWFHRKYGFRNYVYGKWDSVPVEKRNKILSIKRKIIR